MFVVALTMPLFSSVDESFPRLHRAGWSIGETGRGSSVWLVDETNGSNVIRVKGRSQAEAWYRATLQADAVGMLAAVREELDCYCGRF